MKTTHAPRITALRTGTPGDVIAHASIANRDPLQVDLVAWHAVDNIVGQLRDIYATVALASDVKVILLELWKNLKECLEEQKIIHRRLLIIGGIVRFIS